MIVSNIVQIRFKRSFREQSLWVFIGKVLEFKENWIKVEGKGIIVVYGQVNPVDIDDEPRVMLIPRDNIALIRLLPDDFDVNKIEIERKNNRYFIKVKNAPSASLGELGGKA